MEERYITTVDLGSSKIALTVARISNGQVEIIYYKETPSDGVRYSCVYNPKRASVALGKAVRDAEEELGIKILQVAIGLPGFEVQEISASAAVQRGPEDGCIRQEEIEILKSNALDEYPLENPDKEEIYGAVAQSFGTDDMIGVSEDDIVGMTGDTLEGHFKVFVGARKPVYNVDTMLGEIGVAPAIKYFTPASTADAILTQGEKDNGVAMVEIGAGITSLTIFHNGLMRHYSAIPFGGSNVTSDIRRYFGQSERLSENIKLAFGACMPDKLQSMSDKVIQINNDEDGTFEQITVRELSEVITYRMREIFEAILFRIEESGYADKLRNGIVLTGGGANLSNCALLLKEMSGYNVRTGYPRSKSITLSGCAGITETSAAASLGMILCAKKNEHLNCTVQVSKPATPIEVIYEDAPMEEPSNGMLFPENETAPIAEEKPKTEHKPRPRREKPTWKVLKNLKDKVNSTLDGTIGVLFDETK